MGTLEALCLKLANVKRQSRNSDLCASLNNEGRLERQISQQCKCLQIYEERWTWSEAGKIKSHWLITNMKNAYE